MKAFFKVLALSLLSVSAFGQLQTFKGDTAATTQATRVNFGVAADGRAGQKASTGPFQRFAYISEVLQATGGSITSVNGKTGPSPVLNTADVAESGSTNLYFNNTRARGAFTASGAIGLNQSTGALTFTQPALSGDAAVASGGSTIILSNVNTSVGSFGSTSAVPVITVNAKGQVTTVTQATITAASIGAADVTAVVPYKGVANYTALSSEAPPASGFLKFVNVASDGKYGETDALYYITPSGKIRKLATIKEEN